VNTTGSSANTSTLGNYNLSVYMQADNDTIVKNITAYKKGFVSQTIYNVNFVLDRLAGGALAGRIVSATAPVKQGALFSLQSSTNNVAVGTPFILTGQLSATKSGSVRLSWAVNGSNFNYGIHLCASLN
jgi:hypothetical protein